MNRINGRRYDYEPKLNLKKVFATIIAFIVIIMVIVSIVNLLKKDKNIKEEMIVPTKYFSILENGKYGVIDGTGKIVIKPTYEEMIVIPNSSKPVFICSYDVDYNSGEFKTKVLNDNNKQILKKYNNISPLENSNNNEIWYEDNILRFEKDGKYGLIDFSGKEILPAEYNNIYSLSGIPKSIIVEKDNLKGVVNSTLGRLVVECNYNDITSLTKGNSDDGYIVHKDGKYGILGVNGKEILGCNYQEIKNVTGDNMYVVKDDSGLKIIDNSLNVIKDSGFDGVDEINGDLITISLNGKKGVINKEGVELISPQYEDLKFACEEYFIAKNNGLYGIIKTDNTVVLDYKYKSMAFVNKANFYTAENSDYTTDIISRKLEVKLSGVIISDLNVDDSYMRVRKDGEYKYYNFNFEEKKNKDLFKNHTLFLVNKDGKYGYVNKDGDLVVNYKYDDAKEQNEFGYCVVKQDGKWGVLAKDGTVILKPSVSLDDNLYIDFIASYHLFDDKNLNLYVK